MNRSASFALRLMASFVVPLVALAAQQPESFITYNEANEPVPIAFGQACATSISPSTDIDRFQFCGRTGEIVWISVQATGTPMDPRVEVYDSSFNLIDSGGCNYYCSLRRVITLPANGTYTILVSDGGLDETGPFTLGLERVPPVLNPRRLPYNTTVSDSLYGGVDVDWFVLHAVGGPPLRINFSSTGTPMDPSVMILDTTGTVLFSGGCGYYCTFQINWTAPSTGTYYLLVAESGLDESGPYSLSLNSLVTAPPTTLASAFECLGLDDGVAGACGVPLLTGEGLMTAGTNVNMHMRHLPASRVVFLVASLTQANLPVFGGILVPRLDFVSAGFASSSGDLSLTVLTVPAGIAPGTTLFTQAFTFDPVAVFGIAGTNAVVGVTP